MVPSMHTDEREGAIEVVLYEREELPPPATERAEHVYERLGELEALGHVDAVSRETWVKRTPIRDCDRELQDTYLSFTSWADRRGVRLTPFFQTRECFSPAEGEHTDWLVTPAFCLGVYDDEGVTAVYPHADDMTSKTVEDGLKALLGDELDETASEPLAAD